MNYVKYVINLSELHKSKNKNATYPEM